MNPIKKIIGIAKAFLMTPSGRNTLIWDFLFEHDQEAFTASEIRKRIYTNTRSDEELAQYCFGKRGLFAIGDAIELNPEEYTRERSMFVRHYTAADGTPFVVMENTETGISTFVFLLGDGYVFRVAIYNVRRPLVKGDIRLFRSSKDCCYYLRPDFGNIKLIASSVWEKQGKIDAEQYAEMERRIQETKDDEEKKKREGSAFYY